MFKNLNFTLSTLQGKTIFSLALGLFLSVSSYVYLVYSNNYLTATNAVTEVSRRNEMIAQKFGFLSYMVFLGNNEIRPELQKAINDHDFNLAVLERGGEITISTQKLTVEPVSAINRSKLSEIKKLWKTYRDNLLFVINQPAQTTQIDSTINDSGQKNFLVRKAPNQERRVAMTYIQDNTLNLFNQNGSLSDLCLENFMEEQKREQRNIFLFFVAYVVLFAAAYFQYVRGLVRPIKRISMLVKSLAQGDLSIKLTTKRKDEIGEISNNINALAESLRATSDFAISIGKYQLDAPFTIKGDNDKLGEALLTMRDNLKKVDEDGTKRGWANNGISLFNDVLRNNFTNFQEFAYAIIYNLIKYLDINQGGFFSLKEDKTGKKYLQLEAAYAYERRRFDEKIMDLDDGLLAQAIIEKTSIYLTEIPANYIHITSGLGEANPTMLFIMPLINENKVFGALEIASFRKLEDFEIDFIKKVAETTSATIASVQMNENTQTLLESTQETAQQLRSQEEEMRQNMEELAATQEALEKREKEKTDALSQIKRQYEMEIEDLTSREKILTDQKNRLQDTIASYNDKLTQAEKLQIDYDTLNEKIRNQEIIYTKATNAKDADIYNLKKEIERLKNEGL